MAMRDAVITPHRTHPREGLCGSQIWRSPESWAGSAQGIPSPFTLKKICIIYKAFVTYATAIYALTLP
jgi:hypothetical protein